MQMLPILVALLLGVAALAFVLYPLYHRDLVKTPTAALEMGSVPASAPSQVTEREQSARNALQEVELDYQLGNLTESDYRSLRERYTRRALLEMKSRYTREQELDALIEEQLQHMKEANGETHDE
ncbi:MAG: hypothetical protein H0W02_13860 [Ktedonobacteraceae bacterium]|nr:hypothetical protein [Ktedonobacteraceae bacterium]